MILTKSGAIKVLRQLSPTGVAVIQDQKSAGSNGGTFSSGAWRTRDLNTIVFNNITGLTLSSNQLDVPKGKYVAFGIAPTYDVSYNKCKFRNITDGADLGIGGSDYSDASGSDQTHSFVFDVWEFDARKTIELQHRCNASSSGGYGFGLRTNVGVVEVYAQVLIIKIGD